MASTKRSQNKCKACGYTWFPRGKNLSLKCPSCGSTDVSIKGASLGVVAVIIVALMIFSDRSPSSRPLESSNASTGAESVSVGATVSSAPPDHAIGSPPTNDTVLADGVPDTATASPSQADTSKSNASECPVGAQQDCAESRCHEKGSEAECSAKPTGAVENRLY